MTDGSKVSAFIAEKRRAKGLTQQQVAEKLNVTYQAVSKWESGTTYPNTELLVELSDLLGVTVDELLRGQSSDNKELTYSKAGVDIIYTNTLKKEMGSLIKTHDPRVLNGLGPFASLYDISFGHIRQPVLVLKSEEPGSKQKLAMEYGYTESICHDMINHLVNDIIVMGAKPLAVLDTIVCGFAEKETILGFIKGMSEACEANECTLVGGETSIQPNVVNKGTYILSASIAGIVDKRAVIDGSVIQEGDTVLAVASNGLHTNGYSLARLLMDEMPNIKNTIVDGIPFIEALMKPHTPYYRAVKELISNGGINGMAHITGGGIAENVKRIIPDDLCANIDLGEIKIPQIFKFIKQNGSISEQEMLNTFNCGVGLIIICAKFNAAHIIKHISHHHECYEIGEVSAKGSFDKKVRFVNSLSLS